MMNSSRGGIGCGEAVLFCRADPVHQETRQLIRTQTDLRGSEPFEGRDENRQPAPVQRAEDALIRSAVTEISNGCLLWRHEEQSPNRISLAGHREAQFKTFVERDQS